MLEKIMRTLSYSLFISFLICLSASSVRSLLCAQCNQHDPGCRSGTILPTQCAGDESYCFVFHVYIGGRQGTFRGCTSRDDTEGCRPIVVNNREGTGCLSVCDWEGCNSSQAEVLALLVKNR